MDNFIDRLLSGKKSKRSVSDQLYIKPTRDVDGDETTFPHITPNYIQQADTLYLPNDRNFVYALVLTDVGSRLVDAEPMKSRNPEDVIAAINKIYKRKILLKPDILKTDCGTEFRGKVEQYLTSIGIEHTMSKPGRHRQVALAERKNQTVGKIIHKIILSVELESKASKNSSSQWVEYLPKIIKAINLKVKESDIEVDSIDNKKEIPSVTFNPDHKIDLLAVGQKVRVQLDNPIDIHNKPKIGTFRSSDIRWSPDISKVKYMICKPNQPIMYILEGNHGPSKIETTAYTRNQLQKVSIQEKETVAVAPVEDDRFEVEKILERRPKGRSFEYLIKWRHHKKSEASWESRKELMKDISSLVLKFDKKLDE